jgi:UDP-N-acetylmuramoylalanine--D-glutamate ligase
MPRAHLHLSDQTMTHDRTIDARTIRGQGILVIGMARSGVACARMLKQRGADVFVSDAAPAAKLTAAIGVLDSLGVRHETGGHTMSSLDSRDWIVTSPGVPPDNMLLLEAKRREIPIIAELEAAYALCNAPVCAVTGSNGKTTTTAWLGSIDAAAGRAIQVGGNIGRPFSEFAGEMTADQCAILEVSTFQLEHSPTFKPHVAAILNITPDHIDRHGSFAEYVRLKFRLLANQTAGDVAVLNADDPVIVAYESKNKTGRAARWHFSERRLTGAGVWLDGDFLRYRSYDDEGMIPGSDRLCPPGRHNRLNAAAAVAMALADGLMPDAIEPGLTGFTGVEHRLEFVADIDGVRYVNDSKATNPDSVAKALASFDRPLIVIMGGLPKGTSFSPLAESIRNRARACVFTGSARDILRTELGGVVEHRVAELFSDAFEAAHQLAQRGDVVLLSPGCASFDQFDNYEHRGRVFKELVGTLAAERKS